jgi:UDP-N-acetylmuramoylalanine--D-glutamate ligase
VKLEGARATVVGLGASGLAAARLLASRGAKVTVNDTRSASELGARADEARALGVSLDLGGHSAERLAQNELIVVSPGVPRLSELRAAEAAGVRVVSEIELAAWFVKGTVVGITGTNGKSTVTTLVGEMCKATGRPTFVGGNLGTPFVDVVGSAAAEENGYVVVELSSFQLERIHQFRAHVGVLLNITDDHLDRYDGFDDYAAAKGRLFETQTVRDFAVVKDNDPLCRKWGGHGQGQLLGYGGSAGVVRAEGGALVDTVSGLRVPLDELGIQGDHNVDNACAAALAARLAGVPAEIIGAVLRSFKGLGHRMQHVRSLDGVEYFDDSKGTNVGASVAAVTGLGQRGTRVVLIAGGVDKGGSYQPLREVMERHGRALVTLGAAAPLIESAFAGAALRVQRAADMEAAVRAAQALAEPSDAVLLSPACASFDMFRSYAHRGDVFAAAVKALPPTADGQPGEGR